MKTENELFTQNICVNSQHILKERKKEKEKEGVIDVILLAEFLEQPKSSDCLREAIETQQLRGEAKSAYLQR